MLRPIWTALGVALFSLHTVFGQVTSTPYDPSPFATIGYITGFVFVYPCIPSFLVYAHPSGTLNNASDVLSGGTLTLNGNIELVIPRNLLVNTPSLTAVAWGEMFTPDGVLNLPLWPEISWEAQVRLSRSLSPESKRHSGFRKLHQRPEDRWHRVRAPGNRQHQ